MRSESRRVRAFTYMNKSCTCPVAGVQKPPFKLTIRPSRAGRVLAELARAAQHQF
jgi:hypothetical protein